MGDLPWGLLLAAGYLLLQIPLVVAIARFVDRDEEEGGAAGNADLPVFRVQQDGIDDAGPSVADAGRSTGDAGRSTGDADGAASGGDPVDPSGGHSVDDSGGVAVCAQCGTTNDATYTFCRRCVRRLPAEQWNTDRERERGRGEERVR